MLASLPPDANKHYLKQGKWWGMPQICHYSSFSYRREMIRPAQKAFHIFCDISDIIISSVLDSFDI